MRLWLELAWRDLRHGGRALWVFVACLVLGVALVAGGGGLYRLVVQGLNQEVRAMFGGDVELRRASPFDDAMQQWAATRGRVSESAELRTMLRTTEGRSALVELQAVDGAYPLVGTLTLQPAASREALRPGAEPGVLVDATLASRLGLSVGAVVEIGDLAVPVRGLIVSQPDRSLRADWNGAPVLLSRSALEATGLVQPFSRIGYRMRVDVEGSPLAWRDAWALAFAQTDVEVRTVQGRGDRIAELLGQVGSALMLVGFSALFIGGLGVFNSVQAFLSRRLATLATLRALGLRDRALATVVLLQVMGLALGASVLGALLGLALAGAGLALTAAAVPSLGGAAPLPLTGLLGALLPAAGWAVAFGLWTAGVFAWPAVARALTVRPAALFRGIEAGALQVPRRAWAVTGGLGLGGVALLVLAMPDRRLGLAFVATVVLLLVLLEGLLRAMRKLAEGLTRRPRGLPFALQLALSTLQRPGSPLRTSLLSLGSALTLLVTCTVVVVALLRTLDQTLPKVAPTLVFYDVQSEQLPLLRETLGQSPSLQRVQTAPLVLGRLAQVNGEVLADSADARRRHEARDEHKLSHRAGNIDDVIVVRGAWWQDGDPRGALVAMEDREADALGLQVGDRLVFEILGQPVPVELAAIYAQRRVQARLWLEAIFSDGVLDPFVTRYVGAAYLDPAEAVAAQDRLAAVAPGIATVRTQAMIDASRSLLGRAGAGLAVIAGVCLLSSLLVLAGVMAANRARLAYEASVMLALGARARVVRAALHWEFLLLAVASTAFAAAVGTPLALGLMRWRLELDASGIAWTGTAVAAAVALVALGAGARVLLAQVKGSPARLLRAG